MFGCSSTRSSRRKRRRRERKGELRRVPERLAAQLSDAGGEEGRRHTGPHRRPRHDVGVVGVWSETAGHQRCERGAQQDRRADRRSRGHAEQRHCRAKCRRRQSDSCQSGPRRKGNGARRQRQRVHHDAEGPRIRRSGDERGRDPHRERQALLCGPRRDGDLHVLVVDARRVGEHQDAVDEEEEIRVRCPAGTRPSNADLQEPVHPAIEVIQVDRQRFSRPHEGASRVRIALRRVDPVDDAARRRFVEVDVEYARPAVHERQHDGASECSEDRRGHGAAKTAHHAPALDVTS